jgi:ubiquitin
MDRDRFEKWLRNIYETREEEISCTECFDLVSVVVDLEISGKNVTSQMQQVKHHLNQCRACREEYEALRDLRLLEEKGEMPTLDDLGDSIQ